MAATPSIPLNVIAGQRSELPLQLIASDCTAQVVLVAATAQAVAVPTGSKWANMVSPVQLFVDRATVAVVPAVSSAGGVLLQVFAGVYRVIPVDGLTSFSVISPAAGTVTVAFYK